MSWVVQLAGKTVADAKKEVLDAGMKVVVIEARERSTLPFLANRVKLYVENGMVKRAIIG